MARNTVTLDAEPTKKRSVRRNLNLSTFISKLAKTGVQNNIGITGDGINTLNNLIVFQLENIARNGNILMSGGRTTTVTVRAVKYATDIIFGGSELGEQVLLSGNTAVQTFETFCEKRFNKNTSSKSKPSKSQSKSCSSGLTFPCTRIEHMYMRLSTYSRKSRLFSIFLTGILESLALTLLNKSAEIATLDKKARIKVKHIKRCIDSDPVLQRLFQATIIGGGVTVPAVVTTESEKKAKAQGTTQGKKKVSKSVKKVVKKSKGKKVVKSKKTRK